ncbi:MAG: coproporphyrinogen dehydrogenase HemZ [Clostridia bacterium]|nr:coproporphyrinogen dehydrogenase HemZ [Clostridia bacterium]
MTIYINNGFHYETENLVRLFFPNDKISVIHELTDEKPLPLVTALTSETDDGVRVYVSVETGDFFAEDSSTVGISEDTEKDTERCIAVRLYNIFVKLTGKKQPWGILTGVRPIKLFRRLTEKYGEEHAKRYFTEELLVSEEKTALSAVTEKHEKKILALSKPRSFSLYVSIPFCPSRCSYCSFVSQTIESAKKLIEPYFELLLKEIEATARISRECGLVLESVYIGGGTPTTLSAEQLSRLISALRSSFDMSTCREFTVEAGRPDTIDREKLLAIKNGGADRISINPQTLNDDVLKVIGRRHTARQTLDAFALARELCFNHINMDLIAGLPTDNVESFTATLDTLCSLAPESITVHTLAMKRSSHLTMQGKELDTIGESPAAGMLRYCEKKLASEGYHPYYLYRQTRMEGNLENVGWSKDGFDGLYNVFVMDETHTILGVGAGAVTKLKKPGSEQLERIFNYKYPYEYINGFETLLSRKERVKTFYAELAEYISQICL